MKNTFTILVLILLQFPNSTFSQENKSSGADVIAFTTEGNEIYGELISVRKNSILFIHFYQPEINIADHLDLIEVIDFGDLRRISIINKTSTGTTCLALGAPVLLGTVIGGSLAANAKDSKTFEEDFKAGMVGAIIGTLVGLAIGLGINALLSSDEEIEINQDFDYTKLIPHARFKGKEPEYLRKIE